MPSANPNARPITECPYCAHLSPPQSKFCNDCGAALNLLPCPHCGAINDLTLQSDCSRCQGALQAVGLAVLIAEVAEPGPTEPEPAFPPSMFEPVASASPPPEVAEQDRPSVLLPALAPRASRKKYLALAIGLGSIIFFSAYWQLTPQAGSAGSAAAALNQAGQTAPGPAEVKPVAALREPAALRDFGPGALFDNGIALPRETVVLPARDDAVAGLAAKAAKESAGKAPRDRAPVLPDEVPANVRIETVKGAGLRIPDGEACNAAMASLGLCARVGVVRAAAPAAAPASIVTDSARAMLDANEAFTGQSQNSSSVACQSKVDALGLCPSKPTWNP
jgi:Double zinc ribbon